MTKERIERDSMGDAAVHALFRLLNIKNMK